MTDRAEIKRLLNQTGRTQEGVTKVEIGYGSRRNGKTMSIIKHQSDVIELLVGALRDALEKPMQKPLTLEDVLKIDDYGEAWWVEYEEGFVTPTILDNDYHQYGEQILDGFTFELADYGKTWRCWVSRPTDEEREAAAWES